MRKRGKKEGLTEDDFGERGRTLQSKDIMKETGGGTEGSLARRHIGSQIIEEIRIFLNATLSDYHDG